VKNVYDDVAWITKLLFLIFNIKHKYKNKSTNYFAYILLLLKFADENADFLLRIAVGDIKLLF